MFYKEIKWDKIGQDEMKKNSKPSGGIQNLVWVDFGIFFKK